jgi:pyridoxine/pyridoxamine 5'-phosphate oxidase
MTLDWEWFLSYYNKSISDQEKDNLATSKLKASLLHRTLLKSKKDESGMVAYTCNPSYSGGKDQKVLKFEGSLCKKVCETQSQPIKAGHSGVCLSSQVCGKHK